MYQEIKLLSNLIKIFPSATYQLLSLSFSKSSLTKDQNYWLHLLSSKQHE